jgi:hypothetical protein
VETIHSPLAIDIRSPIYIYSQSWATEMIRVHGSLVPTPHIATSAAESLATEHKMPSANQEMS